MAKTAARKGQKPNLSEERVARLVEKWRARLLPSCWSIGVRVLLDPRDVEEDYRDAFAYTEIDGAYFAAKITFCAWLLSTKDEGYLDLVACHEVLHVVLHQTEHLVQRALGEDRHTAEVVTENAVETISRALVKLGRGR